MSYEFSVTANTRFEAAEKIEAEFANVVIAQPSHAADKKAAVEAASAFIGVLKEPSDDEQINLYMSGSLSWQDQGVFVSASVNISASIGPKP